MRLRRYLDNPKLRAAIKLFSDLAEKNECLFKVDYFVENRFVYLVESDEGVIKFEIF